jgi:hypothetical protein
MLREDWMALNPSTITGRLYEGFYFGSYLSGGVRKGFVIDPRNPTGMYFLDVGFEAMHFDELQDQLYVLDGTSVKRWDAGATFLTCKARSRVFNLPAEDSFSVGEVIARQFPVTLRLDAVDLNPKLVTRTMAKRPGVFTSPDATTLRRTVTVTSEEPFRLPSLVASKWQIESEGVNPVQAFSVASDMDELVTGQ